MQYKIIAPAGCGKTTALASVVEALLQNNVPPSDILYTTFTRVAAQEAIDRTSERTGIHPSAFVWFGTLHSLCYRLIRDSALPTLRVLSSRDIYTFGKKHGYRFTFSPNYGGAGGGSTKGDYLLRLHHLSNLRKISLESVFFKFNDRDSLTYRELLWFSEAYIHYKEQLSLLDFTDMLLLLPQALRTSEFNCSHIIVDEGQDLSPLQFECIQLLQGAPTGTFHIAGDDDQCIYGFSGADPTTFINYPGEVIPKLQSYRIPRTVGFVATSITDRISKRLPKTIIPRDYTGVVERCFDLSPLSTRGSTAKPKGTWFLLARNVAWFDYLESYCLENNILYQCDRSQNISPEALSCIQIWEKLRRGESITVKDAVMVYGRLKGVSRVRKGFRTKLKEQEEHERITMKALRTDFGLRVESEWHHALNNLTEFEKAFYKGLDLSEEIKVTISTIHGVKGAEADNVVVLPDMTPRTYRGYQEDPDAEHRVFYVACTRARESLYLHEPITPRHYEWPNT